MFPRKLLHIHLKGFVLRMGSLKKSFLTKVAILKLLIMNLKYSDNYQKHAKVSSASSPKEAESRSACWENFVKSIIKPSINDWVLIKDNSRDFRIGKIIMLIKSDDGEVRKAILKTDHSEGVYPITNLRFLECHAKSNDKVDQKISPNVQCRPKRQAAEMVRAKIGQMVD